MEEEFSIEELREMLPLFHVGFTDYTGIRAVSIEKGKCICELEIEKHHLNPISSIHGGVLYTMADVVGGFVCRSMGHKCLTTMNSSISFLNAGLNCKKIIGTGTAVKSGKSTATVEVDITDQDGKLLTKVISTYFILDPAQVKFLHKD